MIWYVVVGIVWFFLGMILFNIGVVWQRKETKKEFIDSFDRILKKMNERCDKASSLTSIEIQDMVRDSFKMGYSTALLAMSDDFYSRTLNNKRNKQ